jgi:hypothetical protein
MGNLMENELDAFAKRFKAPSRFNVYSCTGMSKWAVIGELGVKFGFVYTR